MCIRRRINTCQHFHLFVQEKAIIVAGVLSIKVLEDMKRYYYFLCEKKRAHVKEQCTSLLIENLFFKMIMN